MKTLTEDEVVLEVVLVELEDVELGVDDDDVFDALVAEDVGPLEVLDPEADATVLAGELAGDAGVGVEELVGVTWAVAEYEEEKTNG